MNPEQDGRQNFSPLLSSEAHDCRLQLSMKLFYHSVGLKAVGRCSGLAGAPELCESFEKMTVENTVLIRCYKLRHSEVGNPGIEKGLDHGFNLMVKHINASDQLRNRLTTVRRYLQPMEGEENR
ncbi:hypothetical protein TNCV_1200241 [Trichonephila clavipes]|uniref:Uncharacterized protein n=1 Tax=Trichonephila clavipes TaxID=2585209 RepID=A0A8X6S1V2_TRICX|nr:hypothetical protein TNCV_1200241 [Trichonephila clavipes]